MNATISKCVCKVSCGDEEGTGFLISNLYLLTAYHVVKGHNLTPIAVLFDGKTHIAKYVEEEERYKDLDIALLQLQVPIALDEYLELAEIQIFPSLKWMSRGFPGSKNETGENLISEQNLVNQVLPTLYNKKIDIQLDLDRKLSTYSGLSGAPLIIDGKVAGIIHTELAEKGQAKELNALSTKHFKDLITRRGIKVTLRGGNGNLRLDVTGTSQWEETANSDLRNISDKLLSVCSSISKYRIQHFSREVVSGRLELNTFSQRDVSALKYRVFEVCQDELIRFVENGSDRELEEHEIEQLIVRFTERASSVIRIRSGDYSYPFSNIDSIRKTVLNLIDECFLAFDKDGIYG